MLVSSNQRSGGTIGDLTLAPLTTGLQYDFTAFAGTNGGIIIVVPEPGRMMLLLLGLALALFRRRRRSVI